MTAPDVSTADHAVIYGAGFFETFRTRDGAPIRLAEHLARLHEACARIGIRIPAATLASAPAPEIWNPVLKRMLAEAGMTDGVFRLTVTAGVPDASGNYSAPGEILTVRPLPPPAPVDGIGIRFLNTVRDRGEWRPRPKSLNYLNSLLASRELAPLRNHPADEGVLCDPEGRVSEGVFANLFRVRGDVVATPHEDTGCLPGIGRARLISRLRERGVTVEEVLEPAELFFDADAVAMVSCVRGVVPVARLLGSDGRILREWRASAAHEALRTAL